MPSRPQPCPARFFAQRQICRPADRAGQIRPGGELEPETVLGL